MPAPGSGALNAGYAVVYDNNGDMQRMHLVNAMQQQNLQQQERERQRQEADAAHRFALQKYYGGQFDPSKFDTETDLNKSINEELLKGRKNLAEVLNTPGASDQDIENATQQALVPAQKLYQIGTSVKRNIDASLEGLKDDKTLAPHLGSLKTQAFVNALYTKDTQTGKLRLRNEQELSQVDPDRNYAADILAHDPQLIMNGNVDWGGMRKRFETTSQDLSGAHYTSPGVKSKSDFKAVWRPDLQDLVQDKTGAYKVITKSDPIITKDANGNEVQIPALSQTALNAMQSTPGELANMNVATMHYLAQHSPNVSVEPNTEAFENAKRIMAYQMVKDWGAKAISDKQDVTKSSLLTRIELGYPMPGSGGSGSSGNQVQDVQAAFNDITDTPFTGDDGTRGNIVNGKLSKAFRGIGSTPSMGEVTGRIPLNKLPLSVRDAVANYSKGNDVTGIKQGRKDVPTGEVKVKLRDGVVTGVMTDAGQWFDVTSRLNSNIKQQNTTLPTKQKQHFIQNQGNGKTYQLGGKSITDDMIKKGAKKYRMTEAQYKASIGIK